MRVHIKLNKIKILFSLGGLKTLWKSFKSVLSINPQNQTWLIISQKHRRSCGTFSHITKM